MCSPQQRYPSSSRDAGIRFLCFSFPTKPLTRSRNEKPKLLTFTSLNNFTTLGTPCNKEACHEACCIGCLIATKQRKQQASTVLDMQDANESKVRRRVPLYIAINENLIKELARRLDIQLSESGLNSWKYAPSSLMNSARNHDCWMCFPDASHSYLLVDV